MTFNGFTCKQNFLLLYLSWEGTDFPATSHKYILPIPGHEELLGFVFQPRFWKSLSSVLGPYLAHCPPMSSACAPGLHETRPELRLEDKKPQRNPKTLHNEITTILFPFPFLHFSDYEEICPTFTPPQVTPLFISNAAELEVHHNTGSALANAQLLIQFLVSLAWVRKVDSSAPTFCQVFVPSEQRLGHLLMNHRKNWFYYFPWAWESFFKERSCSLWDDHPKKNDCQGCLVRGSA